LRLTGEGEAGRIGLQKILREEVFVKILFDTNVILDVMLLRPFFYKEYFTHFDRHKTYDPIQTHQRGTRLVILVLEELMNDRR